MKKMFKSMLAVAAVAMAFTSCSKDETESPVAPVEMKTITVVAGSELEGDTRTTLDPTDNSVSWNEAGEYLKVFETVDDVTTAADSGEGVVVDGQALFEVAFTKNETATSFTYNAVYPKSAWVDADDNVKVANLKLITPSTQQPTLASFDGNADLLIAKPETKTEQPATFEAYYKRIVAIGKMTINGLDSDENIISVTFASDKALTGRSYVNLTEGVVSEYGYSNNATTEVKMLYDAELGFKNGGVAYFTCFPAEIAAGEKFTVKVETETKIFTREVTIPENRSIKFDAGKSSKFSVDMSAATVETKDNLEGEYAVLATKNSAYWALSCVETSSSTIRLSAITNVSYDGSGEVYRGVIDDNAIWTIRKSGSNYVMQGANGKYVSWSSGNSANMSDTEYALSFTKNEDGSYVIASVGDPTRMLQKNNTNDYFAFYTTDQNKNLILAKVAADTRTALATPTNVEATADANVVTVTWTAVDNAESYVVTCGEETQTVTEPTATFESLAAETAYDISVVAKPTAGSTEYKDSEAATATVTTGKVSYVYTLIDQTNLAAGEYIIVAVNGASYKAAQPLDSGAYGYLPVGDVEVVDNKIAGGAADAYAFTLEEGVDGFYLTADGYYYYQMDARTNYQRTDDKTSASEWTISIDDTTCAATISSANGYSMQYSASYNSYGAYNSATGTIPMLFKKNDGTLVPPSIETGGGNGPESGTILWAETWDNGGTAEPSAYGMTGTTVYGDATVTYANNSTNTKLYNETLAGGTAPELLLSKNNQTWTISGIPTAGATAATLTFVSNKTSFALTSTTANVTISGSQKSWVITIGEGVETFDLTLKNTSSSNARIDDIKLATN